MTTATPNIAPRGALAESDQKRLALGYFQDAWAEAVHDGIDGDCLAQTALFLAFDTFLGPVYLGSGYDTAGHSAYYLFLGRTF